MSDRFILVGHPVGHSVSPAIHRRAYELLDRKASYDLYDAIDEAAVREAVQRIARGELTGANVTVPWKQLALTLADSAHESAALVGAANVLCRSATGEVVAYNTDALALADELAEARALLGPETGKAALVLGTGGAALAAVVSCRLAGYEDVRVTGRRFTADEPRASWPSAPQWKRLNAAMVPWPAPGDEVWTGLGAIVQATSAGMKGQAGGRELAELVPWSTLPPLVAFDLVYNPPRTPFLELAQASGHRAVGGLGMLVGQAARAIEIWWGVRPPSEPLQRAAGDALGLG